MGDVIFARTRHDYGSYADFWRVVELSGYPICYVDEIDADSNNTYIFTPSNGETTEGWPSAKAKIVHWMLEYGDKPDISGVAETWHMDAGEAKRIGARYVPVGGHEGLATADVLDEQFTVRPEASGYDAAYIAYMIPRRSQIEHDLRQTGLNVYINNSCWGAERHRVLSSSRAYLHIHQHADHPAVPALRMIVAAAHSLPVISERVADRGIFGPSTLLTADYASYVDFVELWLKKDRGGAGLADFGASLHRLLCVDRTFRKVIEANV